MKVINQINCSPSLLESQRSKIKAFLKSKLEVNNINIDEYDFELQTMRKYQLIQNGKLNLKFSMTGKTKDYISEETIADNDVFIPVGIALGFLKTPLIGGTTFEAIENQKVIYFNSATEFAYTAIGAVSQAKAFETLYYSLITFVSGNDNLVSDFDTRNLKNIPQVLVEGQYYYQNGVYYPLTEFPILNGDDNIVIKFDPPAADTASASGDPATEKTYAVLELIGYNISQLAKPYQALYQQKKIDCRCVG